MKNKMFELGILYYVVNIRLQGLRESSKNAKLSYKKLMSLEEKEKMYRQWKSQIEVRLDKLCASFLKIKEDDS